MSNSVDSRAFDRFPFSKQVQLMARGMSIPQALAINISLGGLLLGSALALPVGSRCKVSILQAGDTNPQKILVDGTVVRSDAHGTAVQFTSRLDTSLLAAITKQAYTQGGSALVNAYLNYFKVSQNKEYKGSQQLLGVSPTVFRKVFIVSFATCATLAVIPVWIIKDSLYWIPNWIKIVLSFGYVAIWFAIIQPMADLTVFRFMKNGQ